MVELSDKGYKDFISSEYLTLVEIWAPWCIPCKAVLPILESLETSMSLRVGKLNVDENPSLANKLDIQGVPTFLFYKKGKILDSLIGSVSKQILEERITQYT